MMETKSSEAPTGGIVARVQRPAGTRYFTPEQRQALLEALRGWTGTPDAFCAEFGVSRTSLYMWRHAVKAHGSTGLRGRRGLKPRRGQYSPEQRRQAVEQYLKQGGQGAEAFAKVWGITARILRVWVARYQAGGPKALEGRPGRKPGRVPVPAGVAAAIVETKTAFPTFGLRKVRDFLARFKGVKASPPVIRRVVAAAQLPAGPSPKRRWVKKAAPRFFERAKPGELWQTDITSFTLPRSGQRVYLVVFLDDHSRYVVSWKAGLRQTSDFVLEALLEGIHRWGKPKEILSDQGRQYFSWRGKSPFQKLLAKQGIAHVVSRSHHPETLGKCERLWATIGTEVMSRVTPSDLADFQARLGQYFIHYGHFRPHQGLGGSVPADRYFGSEPAVRAGLEARMSKQALALALGERARPGAYLVGQIGDQAVSLHGEGGKLVVQLPDGRRTELAYDSLGEAPGLPQGTGGNDEHGRGGERGGNGHGGAGGGDGAAGAGAESAEAELCHADARVAGEGVVGGGERGGAGGGAPEGDAVVRALAGAAESCGAGGAVGDAAGAGVADEPAGAGGAGGGAVEAASGAGEGDAVAAQAGVGGGSAAVAEGVGGGGAEDEDSGGPGAGVEGVPGAAAGAAGGTGGGGNAASAGAAEGKKKPTDNGEPSAGGSE